ncbi:MAG: hypothetical protein ACI9T9_002180, partial [Oleiphilaceae bacterium]
WVTNVSKPSLKRSALSQLLTKKKDRFAAHSKRFLANHKGSAFAHFRSLS